MTSALLVPNPLPSQLTALSGELVARRDVLLAQVETVAVTDLASLVKAEALWDEADRFAKQVAKDRLALTRQIDDISDKIRAIEKGALAPLQASNAKLATVCRAYRDKIRREQEEAERKAREEAERIAAEQRRAAEEQRKADLAKWQAEQDEARAEAEKFGEPVAEVAPPPPAAAVPELPIVPAVAAPELPKSTMRTSYRTRTVIIDRAALLAEACKNGGRIAGRLVLLIDERAVDELVKAGVTVPGTTSNKVPVHGAAGRR